MAESIMEEDDTTATSARNNHYTSSSFSSSGASNNHINNNNSPTAYTTTTTQNNNDIVNRNHTRKILAEQYLSHYFMSTVFAHKNRIQQYFTERLTLQKAGMSVPSNLMYNLTQSEKDLFDRGNYYGWPQGMFATIASFGIIYYGGRRLAAFRKARSGISKLPQFPPRPELKLLDGKAPTATTTNTKGRRSRSFFIQPPTITTNTATTTTTNASSENISSSSAAAAGGGEGENDSTYMDQLQFISLAGLSIALGIIVANMYTDYSLLYTKIEKLPLLPGKSLLCHRACPELLDHTRKLLVHNNWDPIILMHSQRNANNNNNNNKDDTVIIDDDNGTNNDDALPPRSITGDDIRTVPQFFASIPYTPKELMRDPETSELESMVRLLRNCQSRMSYAEELKQQQQQPGDVLVTSNENNDNGNENKNHIDDDDDVVTIPEPGVPVRYLTVEQ